MLDSDRELVTPTGPPLEEPLRPHQAVAMPPARGSTLLPESSDTDAAADGSEDKTVPHMKRSHEMMFTDDEIAAREDPCPPSKRLSESKDDNLSGSVLTISSGSDATIVSAEKRQLQELEQQQKLEKSVEMTRSGLTDSTSSSLSQPAVMSTMTTSRSGDILSSLEESKDEPEGTAAGVAT